MAHTHHIQGVVAFLDIGPGFWGIIDETGGKWRPVRMPPALKKTGLRGTFELKEVQEEISIFMWGTPVEVVSFKLEQA